MPTRAGRITRAGAQGVCSVLLIVFGTVIVLPGVIIIAFQDDVNNEWGIVGMCVLGFGAVCLIVGLWMCSSCFSLCCKKDERRTTAERERNRQNRRKRGKTSRQSSNSTTQNPQVGYLPPNPGTRPTSGGYLPMNAQQGYQFGPSNSPIPPSPIPVNPSHQPHPAVSNPGPTYRPQNCYPPASSSNPLPPAPFYPTSQPFPAVSIPSPLPSHSATTAENLPYNPHFLPVSSASPQTSYFHQSTSAPPTAPPQDDRSDRPPTYDEAMSVNKM